MATYYFDSIAGSDSTGDGLTPETAWATFQGKYSSTTTADKCYFLRGTSQIISGSFQPVRGGSSMAAMAVMGAYGSADSNPVFTYPSSANSWGYILNGSDRSYVEISDLDFDCTTENATKNGGILISATTTVQLTGWRILRSRFYNAGRGKQGLLARKDVSATTATVTGLYIEDSDFFDNGVHGLQLTAVTGALIRRSRAYRNGGDAAEGGHGFSSLWNRTDYTSGWTQEGATTIYKRTLTAAQAGETGTVRYVQTGLSGFGRLEKVSGTTPASGEFSVDAGVLYINCGANPTTTTVRVAFHRCGGIVYEDCRAWDNIATEEATYVEGHGFAFDDFTEDSVVRRCRSYSNGGLGYSVNRGDRNVMEDSLAYGNGINGLAANSPNVLTVRRSTFYMNNQGNTREPAGRTSEIALGPEGADAAFSQLVIVGKSGLLYGIDDNASASGTTVAECSITGVTNAATTATPSDPIEAEDPELGSDLVPLEGSPLEEAGTHTTYVRDAAGNQRWNPPAIGALERQRTRNPRI